MCLWIVSNGTDTTKMTLEMRTSIPIDLRLIREAGYRLLAGSCWLFKTHQVKLT